MSINGKNKPCLTRMGLMPDVISEVYFKGLRHYIGYGDPYHRQQIIFWTLPRLPKLEAQQYRGKAT